jgi:hypothetical protein
MHVAYLIGLFAGVGAALGLGVTGSLRRWELGLVVSAVVLVVAGLVLSRWPEAVGGVVGAAGGAFGAGPLVTGTLRRGGTRGGTAALLAAAAVVGAGFALIPVVGYLEALAVPLFGLRLRRRTPDRHAGLRTLARD